MESFVVTWLDSKSKQFSREVIHASALANFVSEVLHYSSEIYSVNVRLYTDEETALAQPDVEVVQRHSDAVEWRLT